MLVESDYLQVTTTSVRWAGFRNGNPRQSRCWDIIRSSKHGILDSTNATLNMYFGTALFADAVQLPARQLSVAAGLRRLCVGSHHAEHVSGRFALHLSSGAPYERGHRC